jgi:hypothetical protein
VKGILKHCGFWAFMAAMLWGVTGCSNWFTQVDDQTFDELSEIKFIVTGAYVQEPHNKLFPYSLSIRLNETQDTYAFYSDEACTARLREDTLITLNGKPTAGLYRTMTQYGYEFEVYLDYFPEEGDVAEFSPEWFFAMSYKQQKYPKRKARIVTESIPIQFSVAGEDINGNLTLDELPVIEYWARIMSED